MGWIDWTATPSALVAQQLLRLRVPIRDAKTFLQAWISTTSPSGTAKSRERSLLGACALSLRDAPVRSKMNNGFSALCLGTLDICWTTSLLKLESNPARTYAESKRPTSHMGLYPMTPETASSLTSDGALEARARYLYKPILPGSLARV